MRTLHSSDLSSAPIASDGTWRRECAQFATSTVWWRVDKWYREASLQRELREPLMAVFEHVRAALIALLDVHFSESIDSQLHAFLRQKLARVKLRFVTSAPEKYTSGTNLTNFARFYLQEVLAVHRHSFARFAPFRDDDGHMLDAIDIPSFTPNAFYCATDNTLVILPGMLNGAFYDYRASTVELLPTVGSLMGHELAHAIDTRGIWYGFDGSVIDHSARDQVGRYLANMACIVDTFSAYRLDGERVLDESFADAVGLQAAFYAYQLQAKPTTSADHQKFFIQYAQLWCGQMNDQSHALWEQHYGADAHAPPRARVDFAAAAAGVHAAFHCPADTLHVCKPLA
jgi:predicted metalloendopeptidase